MAGMMEKARKNINSKNELSSIISEFQMVPMRMEKTHLMNDKDKLISLFAQIKY